MAELLRVNNIFESISGEAGGFLQGTWITGVRLQGCNLKCAWCDAPQAGESDVTHSQMALSAVLSACTNKHVLITGGEPLLHPMTIPLIEELLRRGHKVQVETNGTLGIPFIQPVHWVVDHKTPSSGMADKMPPIETYAHRILRAVGIAHLENPLGHAYVKWVIADDGDLDYAIRSLQALLRLDLGRWGVIFIFSPIDGRGSLIERMVQRIKGVDASLLDHIVFSAQLHKLFKMP